MHITKQQLNNIIKEETQKLIKEGLMGDMHNRFYGPDDTWVDAVKLALSDRDLMKVPVRPSETEIPFNEDPAFIVSDLDPRQLVKIILNLYHHGELVLDGQDEDTYKMMDDLHAVGHGGEPRYQDAYKLKELFGGLNSGLDQKLP
tara:strand:+ start:2527 stop:2961 length:435 start_codon:yes stop_codon:yes gene_type:complete